MSIWDRYINIYDRLWVQKVSLVPTRVAVIKTLKHLKDQNIIKTPIPTALDISCGTGQLLTDLKRENLIEFYIGLEPSLLSNKAREKGHTVIKETIEDFHPIERYDLLTCTHALPYYEDIDASIIKMAGFLKDEGILLIACAHRNNLYDRLILGFVKFTTSKANYPTQKSLTSTLENSFEVLSVHKINKGIIPSIYLYCAKKKVAK